MSQQPSPLFRLPRELRDEIYRYSVLEPGGYLHHGDTGRLRTASNAPINLSLSYTCKQIATEAYGAALRENTITFRCLVAQPHPTDGRWGSRFDIIRGHYHCALRGMLAWASGCVTTEHLNAMQRLYPLNEGIRKLRSVDQVERTRLLELVGIPCYGKMQDSTTLYALRDMVTLISTHHAFNSSTAKEYDAMLRNGQIPPYDREDYEDDWGEEYNPEHHSPRYAPGSEQKILALNLQPWRIPSATELDKIEGLLPEMVIHSLSDSELEESDTEGGLRVTHKRRLYFSATACSIRFFEKLPPETRGCIRRVVIEEDHESVGDQPSHAYGLIRYCRENPRLYIETRVDVTRVIFLDCWKFSQSLRTSSIFTDMARWFREALGLSAAGMPKGQYTLEFEGTTELLQHLWNGIKRVAALQEAAESCHRGRPENQTDPLLVNRISADFPQLVKKILTQNTPVRFKVDMGEEWDPLQAVHEYHELPTLSYPHFLRWDDLVSFREFEQPATKWIAMHAEYITS